MSSDTGIYGTRIDELYKSNSESDQLNYISQNLIILMTVSIQLLPLLNLNMKQ